MGEIFELEGADFDEAPWDYLIALMFFPEDTRRRAELLKALKAARLRQVLQEHKEGLFRDLRLPLDLSLEMQDQAVTFKDLQEEMAQPLARGSKGVPGPGHGGPIAGDTLLMPLVAWRKLGRRISRGAAYRVFGGLIPTGASERMLQLNWMKYRAAAHVWAAARLAPGLMFNPEGLAEFVAIAQQIRIDAAEYVPPHEREPLLPLDVSANLDFIDLKGADTGEFSKWVDYVDMSPELIRLLGLV